MANWDFDKVFDALEIRDTDSHESGHVYIGEFNAETLVIYNETDQTVTLKYQGSVDDTSWIDIGSDIVIAAGVKDYETVTDFFPEYRLLAQCASAPTTGSLSVWVMKAGG